MNYLKDPGAISGESVASMDNMSMTGKAAQQISNTLDECVRLGMN